MNRVLETHMRLMQQLPVRTIARREEPRVELPPGAIADRNQRIRMLRVQGVSYRATARLLGITNETVKHQWRKMDREAERAAHR